MNIFQIELTEQEAEIYDEVMEKIVYTVTAHFSESATESTEGKVNRILNQNITL